MGFSVTTEGLEDLQADWRLATAEIGAGCAKAVRHAVKKGEETAKREAPRRDGGLIASIKGELVSQDANSANGVVKATAPYAAAIHDGSRAHEITGNPLAFKSGGKQVFTRRVQHPGTKADPFIDRAEPETEAALASEMKIIVDAAVAKFGR